MKKYIPLFILGAIGYYIYTKKKNETPVSISNYQLTSPLTFDSPIQQIIGIPTKFGRI